jgi:hypothetical protein
LRAERIHVDAVKFPAVPANKARLRIQLNAGHTHAQIDHLVDVLEDCQHLLVAERHATRGSVTRDAEAGVLQIA